MPSLMLAPNNHIDEVIAKYGIQFPVYASFKIDGYRAAIMGDCVLTRSYKRVPNSYIQLVFGVPKLEGFDGELVVGRPNDKDVFFNTSAVRRIDGKPDAVLHVFDMWNMPNAPFSVRYEYAKGAVEDAINAGYPVKLVDQKLINSQEELDEFEAEALFLGYEGVMIRKPESPYVSKRCTAKEGYLLKIKRFSHDEAQIIGHEELVINENEAYVDETGHQKRSTHQENMVPGGVLGALLLKDLKTGVEFKLGSGFTDVERAELWVMLESGELVGEIVRYKHFPIGVKDKPRFPIWAGFRGKEDL